MTVMHSPCYGIRLPVPDDVSETGQRICNVYVSRIRVVNFSNFLRSCNCVEHVNLLKLILVWFLARLLFLNPVGWLRDSLTPRNVVTTLDG